MTLPTLTTYTADAPMIRYSVETNGDGSLFVETWEVRVSEYEIRAVPRTVAREIEWKRSPHNDRAVGEWLRSRGIYGARETAIGAARDLATSKRAAAVAEAERMCEVLARLGAL